MRKLFLLFVVAAVAFVAWDRVDTIQGFAEPSASGDDVIAGAFRDNASGIQVSGKGLATKILPDDNDGSRHQRFILKLPSGQTLLVAHNIDLAPRIESLRKGDSVEFNGVYEWNSKGGIIHWTHHDPEGRHEAGWLRHNGKTYQ